MASKIFKPRRGKKSTMAGTKKTTVLSAGEMFIEVPDTGAGTGHSKMKIGDGSTQYSSLPYAMGDTENDKIAFSNDTSGNITTALNKVTSGAALKTMIAALKQAVSLANTSITQLNDDLAEMETNFQAGVDTLYNKCVSCGQTPIDKSPTSISNAIQDIYNNRYNEGVSDALDDASSKVDQILDDIGSTTNNGEFCLSNEIDYDSFTYTQEGLYIYSTDASFDKDPKFGYCIDGRYCHVNMRWTYTGQYQAGHTAIAGFPFPMYAFTGWYDMGHTKVDDYGSYDYAPRLSLAGILSASSAQYNRWMHHTFTYRIKFS